VNIANISYLNLLPFRFFLKKKPKSFAQKLQSTKRGSYPSKINEMFRKKLVDAAFISSVESTRTNKTASGIVAKKAVKSVIVKLGTQKSDNESATSNRLAKVLGLGGEVFIGDKALLKYLANPSEYVDLAAEWNARTGLPFVFGRFCFNRNGKYYKKLSHEFNRNKINIPHYVIDAEAKQKGFETKDAKEYLKLISYKVGAKEERGFSLFIKKAKKL
jgi:chorismate dehydratase